MKFIARIDVMPRQELRDETGVSIAKDLKDIDINGIDQVRVGKHIEMKLQAMNDEEARSKVEIACEKIFSDILRETFSFTVKAI